MDSVTHRLDRYCDAIRNRGLVQGVGFRPSLCRKARELGVGGEVRNDDAGD